VSGRTTVRLMTRLATRDRNGAESSEQITEDGWTHEGHCWRGSRQRVQRADTRWGSEGRCGRAETPHRRDQ